MISFGDFVQKKKGYSFPGVVVGIFCTTAGHTRYIVECTAKGAEGCLHIFSEKDLELRQTTTETANES